MEKGFEDTHYLALRLPGHGGGAAPAGPAAGGALARRARGPEACRGCARVPGWPCTVLVLAVPLAVVVPALGAPRGALHGLAVDQYALPDRLGCEAYALAQRPDHLV